MMKNLKMSNETYDVLKKIVQVVLPALATLLGVCLPIFGVDAHTTKNTITVLGAVTAFAGSCLGVSTKHYNQEQEKEDK